MQKLFFSLIAVLAISFSSKACDSYHLGEAINDFSLKSTTGKMVALKDYKDAKGFIITFTCNHCPYAIAYEDRINALNKKYAKAGYPVIAINPNDEIQYPDDNFENMVIRAKEKGFTFPYLHDESQAVAKKFGALKTPHMYIVQKEGEQFILKYSGAIDDNWQEAEAVQEKYVESAVDALLAGKEVNITYTKAIGCGIKWKK